MKITYTPFDLLAAIRDKDAAHRHAFNALVDAEENPDSFTLLKRYVALADDADHIGILLEREAKFKGQREAA